MIELRVGGMPLIDDKFRMVTNISATDIRSMGAFEASHFAVLDSYVLSTQQFADGCW